MVHLAQGFRAALLLSLIFDTTHASASVINEAIFTTAIENAGFTDAIFYGATDNCIVFLSHTVQGLLEVFEKHTTDKACTKTDVRVMLRHRHTKSYEILVSAQDGYIESINVRLPLIDHDKPLIVYLQYKNEMGVKLTEAFYDELQNRLIVVTAEYPDQFAQQFVFTDSDPTKQSEPLQAEQYQEFALTNFFEVWRFYGDTLASGYVYAHGQSSVPSPVFALDENTAKPIELPWTANGDFDHIQSFAAYGRLWIFLSIEKAQTLRVTAANGDTFEKHGTFLECTDCEFNGFIGVRGAVDWAENVAETKFDLKYIDRSEKKSLAGIPCLSYFLLFISLTVPRLF